MLACSRMNIPCELLTFTEANELGEIIEAAAGDLILDFPFDMQASSLDYLSEKTFSALDWVDTRRVPILNVAAFQSPVHEYLASTAVLSGDRFFIVPGWNDLHQNGLTRKPDQNEGTSFLLGGTPSLQGLEDALFVAQRLELPRPFKLLGNFPQSGTSLAFDEVGFAANPLVDLTRSEFAVTNGGVSLIQATFSRKKIISLPQNNEEYLFANYVKSIHPQITLRGDLKLETHRRMADVQIQPTVGLVPGHELILTQLMGQSCA